MLRRLSSTPSSYYGTLAIDLLLTWLSECGMHPSDEPVHIVSVPHSDEDHEELRDDTYGVQPESQEEVNLMAEVGCVRAKTQCYSGPVLAYANQLLPC